MKLLLFSIFFFILTQDSFSSNDKEKNSLDCSKFLKGSFLSYNKLDNTKRIIKRNGSSSDVYEMDSKTILIKSNFKVISNCVIQFSIYEINSPEIDEDTKNRILNFKLIEEIYKIEGNKAYHRGLNCKCEGQYIKID
jgi:hypothetical protein